MLTDRGQPRPPHLSVVRNQGCWLQNPMKFGGWMGPCASRVGAKFQADAPFQVGVSSGIEAHRWDDLCRSCRVPALGGVLAGPGEGCLACTLQNRPGRSPYRGPVQGAGTRLGKLVGGIPRPSFGQ